MSNLFSTTASRFTLYWQLILTACAITIAAASKWLLQSDDARTQRLQRKKTKQLRSLADKISSYGCKVHERYPTGYVIVCQSDLAEQLGKNPEMVVIALNLLFVEGKVQRTLMAGYWKLNT